MQTIRTKVTPSLSSIVDYPPQPSQLWRCPDRAATKAGQFPIGGALCAKTERWSRMRNNGVRQLDREEVSMRSNWQRKQKGRARIGVSVLIFGVSVSLGMTAGAVVSLRGSDTLFDPITRAIMLSGTQI